MGDREYLHGIEKDDWGMVLSNLSHIASKEVKNMRVKELDKYNLQLMESSGCADYRAEYRKPHPDFIYYKTRKHGKSVHRLMERLGILHYGSW